MIHWQQEDKKYIWHPCSQAKDEEVLPPIVMERGAGRYLYDIEGKRYLDIISSWWCNLLGHGNSHVKEAVKDQIDELEHVIFAGFSHKPAITLARRLHDIVPPGLEKFRVSEING